MNQLRKTPFIILFIFLSACSPKKYLWMGELQAAHEADRERVIRIYFDRYGDLYPDKQVYINPRYFLPDKPLNGVNSGQLETYFTNTATRMTELCKFYGIKTGGDIVADFRTVQSHIIDNYKKQAQTAISSYKIKKIVIFIHGFNDPNPTGTYQELRDLIRKCGYDHDNNLLFLEVYWDGLTANGTSPGTAGIWGRAQLNTRYVSLGLRDLVNHLEIDLPEIIITHSLGASVGTGALFNTQKKWKDDINSLTAKEINKLSEEPAPAMPIRLGMIAPAIPGVATFADFGNRSRNVDPKQDNIQRVVLGINTHDYALLKGFFGNTQYLAPRLGATTLGCDYKGEVGKVKDLLRVTYGNLADQLIIPVYFQTPAFNDIYQEHGLHFYLQDTEHIKTFLSDLFEN